MSETVVPLKPVIIERLRLGLGVSVILGMLLACGLAALAGWINMEGPVRQYPNSAVLGLPRFVVPDTGVSRCSSLALIMDNTFTTTDEPMRIIEWYQDARANYRNPAVNPRGYARNYQWGPIAFDLIRTPSITILGRVSRIKILTHMQVEVCP